MYPRQTPTNAKAALVRKENDQQTMDPSEVFAMVGMVLFIIVLMCALMVRVPDCCFKDWRSCCSHPHLCTLLHYA